MAQRLATEYVKASLTLTEAEMAQLEQLLAEHGIDFDLNVFGNVGLELVFRQDDGEEVVLSFERRAGKFVSEGSYRLSALPAANMMRKAVSLFKGDAVVNRIYANFVMVYYYERGSVVKIVEKNDRYQKVIYDYKNTAGRLERLFQKRRIEQEIEAVRGRINALLDRRLTASLEQEKAVIDRELVLLRNRLFVLEA